MKKSVRVFPLSLLASTLAAMVASCSFVINPGVAMNSKTVEVYSLAEGTAKKKSRVTFKTTLDDPFTLYATFGQYGKMLETYFKDGCHVSTREVSGQASLTAQNGDSTDFQIIANASNQTFQVGGNLSGMYIHDPVIAKTSLAIGLKASSEVYVEPKDSGYATYSFSKMLLKPIYSGGEYYYPLSLLDAAVISDDDNGHFYDSENLYFFHDSTSLTLPVTEGGVSPAAKANRYYAANGYPTGLAMQNRDSVYFALENKYGLNDYKGHPSMAAYLDELGVGDNLRSNDPVARSKAIFEAFNKLDDDHTGITAYAPWYGEDGSYSVRGPSSQARRAARTTLTQKRTEAGLNDREVHYSSDGKTAYFNFDSFDFSRNPYDETGKPKADLWREDSYFYVLRQLRQIEEKGGVDNLIVDLSINGGGTVGVMEKILALLSKDNHGTLHVHYDTHGGTYGNNYQVDSNDDGKCDVNDVYGHKFSNIVMLTSTMSFSCGNALPYYAKKLGIAKTAGERSGGGECSVNSGKLPTGASFCFSSPMHIGYYDKSTSKFEGDEAGVAPDVTLSYDEFYNVDGLAQKLFH